MCNLVKTYIDFLYRELGEEVVEQIMSIPPGLKILKNDSANLFDHPHVALWHKFLLDFFDPKLCGKPYAIIMPCSATKPYRVSATHRIVDLSIHRSGIDHFVQVYVLSEPMVLVPRELDIYYPFANYDYPTHELTHRFRERFIDILTYLLPRLKYHSKIIAVLPKHHLSILLESVKRSGEYLNLEIIEYGRKAFQAVKKAAVTMVHYVYNRL